jgi:hypothetical protein
MKPSLPTKTVYLISLTLLAAFISLISLISFTSLIPLASASSGVSPAYYLVNFEPNFEGEFPFTFNFDSGPTAKTYVSGDLAEYVELDKDSIQGNGKVVATMKLPSEITTPGDHRIRIGAKQIPNEKGGIEVIGDIGGVIKVSVPHPGKYVEAILSISNADTSEDIKITLTVYNKGSEIIEIKPIVEIFNNQEVFESVEFESASINPTESIELAKSLDADLLGIGRFNATAIINYDDKQLKAYHTFRVGRVDIIILDHTKEFERNKINRIQIDLESMSNNPIENVYANITILDPLQSFLTPPITLKSFETASLEGFFSTFDIEPTRFDAKIVIHYPNSTIEKIVKLRFAGEIERLWLFIGGAAIAIILGLIFATWRFKWFRKKK